MTPTAKTRTVEAHSAIDHARAPIGGDLAAHVRWPADRFFWSVIDGAGAAGKRPPRRATPLTDGLASALADDVPLPIDDVHAVAWPLDGGRVLVVAAKRSELADLPSDTLSLIPESVPEFAIAAIDRCSSAVSLPRSLAASLSCLNLLVGEFEPIAIRRAHTRSHLVAAAALVLAGTIASLGLWRRAERWEHHAEAARLETLAVLRDATASKAGQPPLDAFALEREVLRLREVQQNQPTVQSPLDATGVLTGVLMAWPTHLPAHAQSIGVTASGGSISVLLGDRTAGTPADRRSAVLASTGSTIDAGAASNTDDKPEPVAIDAGTFLQALRLPSGWMVEEPRHSTAAGLTRLSLRLRVPASSASFSNGGTR